MAKIGGNAPVYIIKTLCVNTFPERFSKKFVAEAFCLIFALPKQKRA
jgi:hypothetical protein